MNAGPCALCGGRTYRIEWSLPIGTVLSCEACSLVRLVDSATGSAVVVDYDERYYRRDAAGTDVGYPDYFGAEAGTRRSNAAVFAELVLALVPGATSALDVGCGGGYLVDALTTLGVDATGVDGSAFAVEQARRMSYGRFEQATIGEPSFDRLPRYSVVTMMDVIEHLTDPVRALRAAARHVGDGGALIVLTPRYDGRLLAGQGAEYVHFNLDHVLYFTKSTLRATIEAAVTFRELTLADVLDLVVERRVTPRPEFKHKYGSERDSMIAVIGSPVVRDQR